MERASLHKLLMALATTAALALSGCANNAFNSTLTHNGAPFSLLRESTEIDSAPEQEVRPGKIGGIPLSILNSVHDKPVGLERTSLQSEPKDPRPPCIHPGDERSNNATSSRRCSRHNKIDVAYWTSRSDPSEEACRDGSCTKDRSLMMPHCHGWGSARYCHAHPGGEYAHDHIYDLEFADVSHINRRAAHSSTAPQPPAPSRPQTPPLNDGWSSLRAASLSVR